MKLFDSHCHLSDPGYAQDFDRVLRRMSDTGVAAAILVGVNRKDSEKAVRLAASHPGLYASVGVHPHDAENCSEETLHALKALAGHPKVRAWGETGLDFNRMFSPRDIQELWFMRQIETADELDLPLIFHERDSGGRFLEIVKVTHAKGRRGVVHCFSGTRKEMEAYLDLGYHIGITGILTIQQRGADLRALAPRIPLERLLIETDAPYLTPAPQKNKTRRNEPAFVASTLLKLAELRGEDPESLAEATWNNACRLFGIHPEA
ncbi:TatD family hydrolase [Desulfococcus sp.]|uniref:TatD family hydrolase n=1 Tax=Desulfococcus sp. TaxID=2025834 RepID=UPI0035931363